jgi:cytidylate kinase
MTAQVITISRTLASGGEEVGRKVAEELGFSYRDDEIIYEAADKAGVAPEVVLQAEHSRSLVDRVLDAMASLPMVPAPGGPVPILDDIPRVPLQPVIEQVIRATAKAGNVVIVAHAASIPLAGTPGLLRVFVTASPDTRLHRVLRHPSMKPRAARSLIKDSDKERAEYLNRFYGVKPELPTHYDLVVNTDVLTPDDAAELVIHAARA